MKKKLTVNITPAYGLVEGETHEASRVVVSTENTFTNEDLKTVFEVDLLVDSDADLLTIPMVFEFPYFNSQYFLYTETRLSSGEWSGPGPISMVTQNGLNSTFHYSNTIIKTPVVQLEGGRSEHTNYVVLTPDMVVYRGKGLHTHTSYRIISNGEIVWQRLKTPDHLTEIHVPYDFKSDRVYHFQVAHHSGDVQSGWGSRIITTGEDADNIIKIKGLPSTSGKYNLYADVMNFFQVDSNRLDIVSMSWILHDNGVVKVQSDDLPAISNPEVGVLDLHIPGMYLSGMSTGTLFISMVTTNDVITRRLEISVDASKPVEQIVGQDSKGLVYRASSIGSIETISYVNEDVWVTPDAPILSLIKSSGSKLIRHENGQDLELGDHATGFPILTKFYKDMLLVSYVTYVVGGAITYTRKLKVYRYNKLNHQIYNMMSKDYTLGNVTSQAQSFELVELGNSRFAYVMNNNSKIEIMAVDLKTAAEPLMLHRYDINVNERSITPRLSNRDNFLILVSSVGVSLYSEATNVLSPTNPMDPDAIDFYGWMECVERTNGVPTLIGIDKRNVGQELGVVYEFNNEQMKFLLKTTFELPVVNSSPYLGRPSILIDNDSVIGLLYPTETIWLA